MFTIYKNLLNQSKYLEKQITTLRAQIASLPEGKLICKHDKKHIRWLYRDKEHNGYQSIYKSNRGLAEQLAKKKYLSHLLEEAMTEKKAVDSYLRHHDTIRHPKTGRTYYWEHCGMMDTPSYVQTVASSNMSCNFTICRTLLIYLSHYVRSSHKFT